MKAGPSSYNRESSEPHRVWYEHECGWKTGRRKPGRPPKLVVFRPFDCPKCGEEISDFTVYR